MRKYKLTFCEIEQLADDLFEIVDNEGVMIDHDCAEESRNFWDEICKEPFNILVNCKNSFSLSFEGARDIGKHPLLQKTAILVKNPRQQESASTAIQVKKAVGDQSPHKIFTDRKTALAWLKGSA